MLSLEVRIDRAQRLLRMLEEDMPLLARRVAELTPEHQASARNHAAELAAHTRAELDRLRLLQSCWDPNDPTPEPAD
jgi:hypothetical protein